MKAVAFLVVLAMVQLIAEPAQALTCGQVDASLAACVPYLTQGGDPGAACCSGVKSLKALATTTDEKRTACNCAKAAANRYANLKDDAAQNLASKCGVSLDVPVSRTINCDTISKPRGITCGQVDAYLAPCIAYLTQGGQPGGACCTGVQNLKGMASTTDEKRTACNCVKAAANRYSNLKDDAAQSLASKCGVTLDIPVSRTINLKMTHMRFHDKNSGSMCHGQSLAVKWTLHWHHVCLILLKVVSLEQLVALGLKV